jgi:hypothetical protein
MDEDSQETIKRLLREITWAGSKLGRITRRVLFFFGFAQCRHCVHCELQGGAYRDIRESIIPINGHCKWSEQKVTAILDRSDLRTIHRCPGFEQILYNFKNLGFPANEVARIKGRRREALITWMGWMVAVALALIAA